MPPCLECEDDPWVVLATVTPGTNATLGAVVNQNPVAISYKDRRVLLATQRLPSSDALLELR